MRSETIKNLFFAQRKTKNANINKKNKMTKIIKKYRPLVMDTLRSISIGDSLTIRTKDIKASSIRSGIRYLNKKGYEFTQTERGLIDEVKVTRLK